MENYQFKLIDSIYTVGEAKEVLVSLINDKIKSLHSRIFALEERFGTDTSHMRIRVMELHEERQQLLDKLNTIDDNCPIEIDCVANLEIKKLEAIH